ncbi:hypothetical protein OROHE_018492 [Orobanche hederae]
MGERRKRKSAWEEDDTKHVSGTSEHNPWTEKDCHSSHGSGNHHELSESRTRKSRDNSGWPAWESIEEHPNAPTDSSFKNSQDGKQFGGGKRHYRNTSPGFDEMELRTYNDTREYDQIRSPRYPGRGRSRSRSRSRTRSLSRGRDRVRERRRSRSRSRTHVKSKDYTRPRVQSPISARRSYEWSDRRGVPEKSSQICREFSAGSCRRGSQCRFYHPNISSRRDRDMLEDGPTESWRSRTDHNRVPRHSYSSRASSGFASLNDVSDPYRDDRRTIPCKDFARGDCRWGDTCRFSHHAAPDDAYGQGTGNASYDKGKNGKSLCKFFAAGNCSRENCRFSHDDPNNNDRRGVVTDIGSHDKSNRWNGPTWDDATSKVDGRGDENWENENKNWGKIESAFPGESESYGRNTGFYEPIVKENENKNGGKIGSTFLGESGNYGTVTERRSHDKNDRWNGPTWEDAATKNDDKGDGSWENENKNWGKSESTLPGESESYGRKTGFYEPIAKENENKNGGKVESTFPGESGSHGRAIERRSHDKSNLWNGPIWDDAATKIDDRGDGSGGNEDKNWGKIESTFPGESESYGRDLGFYEPVPKENENKNGGEIESMILGENGSYGRNTGFYEPIAKENENKNGGRIESTIPGESGSYGRNTCFYKPIAKENTDNKQENLILYGSKLQDHDEIENVDGKNALQQNSYPAFQIQQHYESIENDQMNSFGSGVRKEVKETTRHPIPFSGHQNAGSLFPGPSSILSESDMEQNVPLPIDPSYGFCADLNEPNTEVLYPLNGQTHTQTDQKASQSPGFLEVKVPELLANLLTKKLSEQVNNSQTYADMSSYSDSSGWVPLVNTSNAQINPGAVPIDLNFMGNGSENADHGNFNLVLETEQNCDTQLKRSSPLSVVGTGFDNSKERQEDIVSNSEVTGGNKSVGAEIKGAEENTRSENQDGHKKVEEGGANKDEKGMRLFKNNLVEFVKEILKPTWKEGRMSRDDHKIVVRKVVDKVSRAIHVDHIPKTQEKVDQYLACSKPKISKLVQAYVELSLKRES